MTAQGATPPEPEPVRLMTMQVIRVRGGRVIEQRPEVRVMSDDSVHPDLTSVWPPCECPRHRDRNRA